MNSRPRIRCSCHRFGHGMEGCPCTVQARGPRRQVWCPKQVVREDGGSFFG